MKNTPFIMAEDAARKGFDFSPWGGIEGFLKASRSGGGSNHAALKRLVPDLAHAVDMTATAVSKLPFDIVDKSGNVFDSSAEGKKWGNKLGGLDNPQRLIYLIASSLCGGQAYIIPTRTPKLIFDLQYAAPHTIQPQIRREGLQYFDRASDQGKTDRYNPKELIYFWLPDSDVEIGPAQNHPLGNAALDAQLVFNLKNTMNIYGERGFVPITLLGAKGMVQDLERQKTEGFFDRLLRGGFDVLAKIINADALTLIRVGAGMDELKQSYLEIRRDAKESIADAFGIPTALFMSDNAFASEFDGLRKQWYSASRFVGIYQTIQEVFSEQLFLQYGYSMRFALETLDIFQSDESKRALSLNNLVSAITTEPSTAKLGMEILGYDLTKEQQGQLDKIITTKQEDKQKQDDMLTQGKVDANGKPIPQRGDADKEEASKETFETSKPPPKKTLTADEVKDLALWYSKAKAWHLKDRGAAVDWENKHLREEIAAPIRIKLANAKNEYDIMQAFELESTKTHAPEYRTEIYRLDGQTEAIKSLVGVIEKAIESTK